MDLKLTVSVARTLGTHYLNNTIYCEKASLQDASFYATIIYNIDVPMNRDINDGNDRCKKNYTFNFTSISIGGLVQ